jgi:hypothetical protein
MQRRNQSFLRFDELEVSKLRERANVLGCEGVLGAIVTLPADAFREAQERIPEPRVVSDDQSGLADTEAMKPLQQRLAILEIAEGIDKQNDVEAAFDAGKRRLIFDISDVQFEVRKFGPTFLDKSSC